MSAFAFQEPAGDFDEPAFLDVGKSARGRRWVERLGPAELKHAEAIAQQCAVPQLLARVLAARGVTADTALRLARFFGMSAEFWLGLQMDYDLDVESDRLGARLQSEVGLYSEGAG